MSHKENQVNWILKENFSIELDCENEELANFAVSSFTDQFDQEQ